MTTLTSQPSECYGNWTRLLYSSSQCVSIPCTAHCGVGLVLNTI